MAKNRDIDDQLFERLHDSDKIKRLHKQAKKELRLKRRKEWAQKYGSK